MLAGQFAREVPWLADLITDVSEEANFALDHGKKVLVEGTQGFGLSLYHSDSYPKATSRDTTAAGFLSEVGLSPMLVSEIVCQGRNKSRPQRRSKSRPMDQSN